MGDDSRDLVVLEAVGGYYSFELALAEITASGIEVHRGSLDAALALHHCPGAAPYRFSVRRAEAAEAASVLAEHGLL